MNLKLKSVQTRVIHVKAPVNLMLCVIRVISSTNELNLVHLIFLKTRKLRAFLKYISGAILAIGRSGRETTL